MSKLAQSVTGAAAIQGGRYDDAQLNSQAYMTIT